jgi:type VI secretion system secreted protein VgrG
MKPTDLQIQHLYHDDASVVGSQFEAILGDGSKRTGITDSAGVARLEDIPPGSVKLRFKPDARPYETRVGNDSPEHRATLAESDFDTLFVKHGGKQ